MTSARWTLVAPNRVVPLVFIAPTPTDPHSPATSSPPASRKTLASTRLTPSRNATGGGAPAARVIGAQATSSAGTARAPAGSGASTASGSGASMPYDVPYSGLHASTHMRPVMVGIVLSGTDNHRAILESAREFFAAGRLLPVSDPPRGRFGAKIRGSIMDAMPAMRSIWNGAITFGLISIPVRLFTAV